MTSLRPNRNVLVIAGLAAGVLLGAAGCEESAPPPPAPAAGTATGAGQARPQSNAPGSSGPLARLSDQPKSMLGRSAQYGKQVAQQAVDRDSAIGGMADEMSGEAVPLEVGGLRWSVPSGWVKQNASGMRAAEFRVPHPDGGDGEAVAAWFFFPDGQGGTVQQNIDRWAQQVRGPGNSPGEPVVKRRNINGVQTTTVELEGTYRDGMPGQPYVERPNYVFRGAIAEGPKGLVFLRLVGPRDIVYDESVFRLWDQLVGGTREAGM